MVHIRIQNYLVLKLSLSETFSLLVKVFFFNGKNCDERFQKD